VFDFQFFLRFPTFLTRIFSEMDPSSNLNWMSMMPASQMQPQPPTSTAGALQPPPFLPGLFFRRDFGIFLMILSDFG
jgi:hypothetical protein